MAGVCEEDYGLGCAGGVEANTFGVRTGYACSCWD